MHIIQLKPAAILMAKEAYDWYEGQKAGLVAELGRCYSKLEKNTLHYQKLKKTIAV